jgi:ABC-type polysaccharide/polyol phosphate transport system ATPase subunit
MRSWSSQGSAMLSTLRCGPIPPGCIPASHLLDPDILIIDEALSTGDARYKVKSLQRLQEMRGENRALIVVSHAMKTLKTICDEVLWLDHGKVMMRGEPTEVIKAYREFLHVGTTPETDEDL